MRSRILAALAALLTVCLCACSRFVPAEYVYTQPHSTGAEQKPDPDALSVSNFEELRSAILALVETGTEHGVIRAVRYEGDLEDDLSRAAYQVAREDPAGDYAIDYITHDATLIVSYYEIHVEITFRDMLTPLDEIEHVTGLAETRRMVEGALERYDDHLTLYCVYPGSPDFSEMVSAYCGAHRKTHAAVPELSVTYFPAEGRSRIVELTFGYPADAAQMREMDSAVADTLRSAGVYVRYRQTAEEKAQLLFSFLAERFRYREQATRTPVFSALCEGAATSESMADCWQMLCEEAGIDCVTVRGMMGGGTRSWNIIELDGSYYHVDVLRDLLESEELILRYDEDMSAEYYWDTAQTPACPKPEPEPLPVQEQPGGDTEEQPPQEPGGEDAPAPEPSDETEPGTEEPAQSGEQEEPPAEEPPADPGTNI